MAIDSQHPEYEKNIQKWQLIDNICEGEDVEQYLRYLNKLDTSAKNIQRNKDYKQAAIFYQVAGYTARGLNGLLFSKWPTLNVPPQLEYLNKNADGAGVSIYQQAQKVGEALVKVGRNGLFVSYPETEGAVSRADMNAMRTFATIHSIDATQIIDWGVVQDGAQVKLGHVVFMETVAERDGLDRVEHEQLRQLSLENGVFIVRKWRKDKNKDWQQFGSDSMPLDGSGSPWNEIPFVFAGSENNAPDVDTPPMQAIAEINKGHFRNSADFEDNVWYCGQAQPWMSGVNQNHVDLMTENNMYAGSREVLAVPDGGQFGYEAATPNTMVRQAMLDKLEMMIGLGARFITPGSAVKTAYEAGQDASVQHSVLSLISSNLSEAYTQALKWVARYMNVDPTDDMVFETTMDFISPTATAQDIQAMVAGFVQGAVPMSAYFKWLQRHGLEDSEKTIEEFSEEVNPIAGGFE